MNADGLSWQKQLNTPLFPQFVFHLSAENEYVSAGFMHCSSSRAVLYHVQEIWVYARTLGFAGLRLEYIHLFICICSNAGFDLQHEDSTAL